MAGFSAAGSGSAPKAVWFWALAGSLLAHLAFLSLALSWKAPAPAPKRSVVPVETVTLIKVRPEPAGGGGPSAPVPQVRPQPKPLPKPKPRPKPKEVMKKPENVERLEPPPALALPRPAPPTRPVNPGRTTALSGRGTGSGRGQGGSGGGSGGGRGPGVGSGEGPGAGTGSLLQGYLREVRRLLERQKQYPKMAQRLNMEGVAVLRFTIAADGGIRSTGLARSSGHDVLDAAAQETVKKVGRFPPLPPSLGKQSLSIQIPLTFRLTKD